MGHWGIASSASEIEKIKSDFADCLGGSNSCGHISYGLYSEAYDFGMTNIDMAYELGKIFDMEGKDLACTRMREFWQSFVGTDDVNQSFCEADICYGLCEAGLLEINRAFELGVTESERY